MELKFDEKGLIPAIVQDHYTKEVLTLAYMNAESLALTIDERRTCFWSRSRQGALAQGRNQRKRAACGLRSPRTATATRWWWTW
jgi:phosphoribosyl-AMP cyclohydrolase